MKMLFVLVVLVGCGASPEAPRCELGRVQSCPCVGGGQGAQECGASGVWGVCACPASDAATPGDGARDAASDTGGRFVDVPRDADPRCGRFVSETSWCEAGDAGVCVDLQSDPRNCGRCGMMCNGGYECFGGFCFVRPADAGRD